MKLWNRAVEWYDWKIYWLFWRSLNRMIHRNGGFALLIKMHLESHLAEHPPSKELQESTERFYEALKDWPKQ